uniref:N-alpha-acetyltransferase 80 n=1 Tax=Anolis carolinensis TaxID=28377 RepID=G1KI36_ANOCA
MISCVPSIQSCVVVADVWVAAWCSLLYAFGLLIEVSSVPFIWAYSMQEAAQLPYNVTERGGHDSISPGIRCKPTSLFLCFQEHAKLMSFLKLLSEMLTVVPLHQRPDLLEACVDLINEEWKRSRASRIHSLQRSSDSFPLCLVLIRTQRPVEETAEGKQNQSQLLGHARLSRVVGRPKSLFVETVVIAKSLRGKGYGRKLMEAVESYAKSRGFCHLHLTTHDKQHFYAHLGYRYSKPVQCAGFVSSLVFSFQPDGPCVLEPVPFSADNVSAMAAPQPTSLPPPPPVPPPVASLPRQPNSCELASCGPPGDKGPVVQGTPYRDLKGRPIFWMEKDI